MMGTDPSLTSSYSLSIGSKPENDLIFDKPTVSARHAHVFWNADNGAWMLEDLGSTNGTFLRGVRLSPGQPVLVQPGDAIYLGKTFYFILEWDHLNQVRARGERSTLQTPAVPPASASKVAKTVSLPPVTSTADTTLPGEQSPLAVARTTATASMDPLVRSTLPSGLGGVVAEVFGSSTEALSVDVLEAVSARLEAAGGAVEEPLDEVAHPAADARVISIGYHDDCTVQIKNPVVSGHHARLYQVPDGYVLEDQGSTNGTWVRGQRIKRVRLSADDAFSVSNHRLQVADLIHYFDGAAGAARPDQTFDQRPSAETPILVGRSPDCQVQLDAPMVSGIHAQLTPLGDGYYLLEDQGSTNGTYVNSRENRVQTATVGPQDVIFFGSYRLPLSRLGAMLSQIEGEEAIVLPEGQRVMTVGRDDDCDIVLKAPQVSRKHAEIRRLDNGGLEVRDLGSINGTFVNGQRIKTQRVTATDLVAFASVQVRLDARAGVARRDYQGDIMLQAERVTVRVRDKRSPGGFKTIVDDASFTAYPTEFVGLMGPSGAGKTTLMLALNGYTLPNGGRSLINGYDLYTNYNAFRGNIGYVPQDDIIYRELTVYESLYYTAKLRLPADTTDIEIDRKIEDVLEKLEIQQTRDVLIGDALKKGISGGQRKRVNLAQELITEPSLLFLDEPTSGLASEDTINVMNLLRRLADEGRTIILTIHQPSLEAYRKLDNVIYLFQGRLVYYGPAYPDGIAYFYPDVQPETPEGSLVLSDPGSALRALHGDQRAAMDAEQPWQALEQVVESRRQGFLSSNQYRDYVYDRAVKPRDEVRLAEGSKQKTQRRGWLRQLGILTRRNLTIKRKDIANTAILLLQAPIIGLVLWFVFAHQVASYFDMLARGPAALFLLVASAVWFGCSNSAREIVREQPIYKRERMVNLMIRSYVLSKFLVLGLICALQCALLLGIVYPALGYTGSFWTLYGILLLASLAGVGMGLTLSAVVRSSEAAMALVPLLLIPQIVLGGIIMPIHELNPGMKLLSTLMVSRWGFEALLHVEYGDDDLETIRESCGIDVCPDPMSIAEADADDEDEILYGAFGEIADRSYFPSGQGVGQEVCAVLCVNARTGTEVTPRERAFGLDFATSPMRSRYRDQYAVGTLGDQSPPWLIYLVLGFFNVLLFALVCAILRYRDVEVG